MITITDTLIYIIGLIVGSVNLPDHVKGWPRFAGNMSIGAVAFVVVYAVKVLS